MIVVGLFLCALLAFAFAGRGLGDPRKPDASPGASAGTWDCVLFLLLLAGIVARKRKEREDEDF